MSSPHILFRPLAPSAWVGSFLLANCGDGDLRIRAPDGSELFAKVHIVIQLNARGLAAGVS